MRQLMLQPAATVKLTDGHMAHSCVFVVCGYSLVPRPYLGTRSQTNRKLSVHCRDRVLNINN